MNRHSIWPLGAVLALGAVLLIGATVALANGSAGTFFGRMAAGSGSGGMMNGSGHGGMMNGNNSQNMMNGTGSGGIMGGSGSGGMMGNSGQTGRSGKTISIEQARRNVQRYIDRIGTKSLAIDEVIEFQRNFYAIVTDTSTGHGAFEVLVNKSSGRVFPEFGPAMMWNTEYGMMSRGMGQMMGYQQPSGPMTVSAAKAGQIARQWLDQNKPNAAVESPDQFPGYYTIHFQQSGKMAGMLSVNGYTGQVWYHTWHGAFIR